MTKNINIIKEKAICFSGHRRLESDFDEKKLERLIIYAIEKGYDTFLVGMALGFDTVCFHVLEKLRKENDIKIIACIPCENQDERFNIAQKKEYRRMIESADEKVVLNKTYTNTCMQERNIFMVDNSCILITYLRQKFGGTFNTYNYAKKNDKKTIII